MLPSSGSIILGAVTDAQFVALGWLSLEAGWQYPTVGAFWSSTVDLSQSHTGTLSGLMNTGANLDGTLSPTVTPWIAEHLGWSVALGRAGGIAFCGGLLWILIKPGDGLRVRRPTASPLQDGPRGGPGS